MHMKNLVLPALAVLCFSCGSSTSQEGKKSTDSTATTASSSTTTSDPGAARPVLDTAKYDQLMQYLANGDTSGRWPVKHDYPLAGAILPFNRVVAYYGN